MFDRLQDGEAPYSDGTPIEALMPLQDRSLPPQRDDLYPGSDDDPGAMGINYRCEPMVERWSRPEQSITAVSAPWRKTTGRKPSSPHR